MGRTYAGILGFLAYATVIARSFLDGGSIESTLKTASMFLFLFAALGYVFGSIAEATVNQSLRHQLAEQRRLESKSGKPGKAAEPA